MSREWGARVIVRDVFRAGSLAGLAMIPFGLLFRANGLRVNEYGRKTLELVAGELAPGPHFALTFVQHMLISWIAAVPLLLVLRRLEERGPRLLAGLAYGGGFYVALNSLALPVAFGDPTPWELGFATIYPSLVVHGVYGAVLALCAKVGPAPR